MSDQALRYVPREPSFRPNDDRAHAAARWLERTIGASVQARVLAGIEFVDAGQIREGVRCSAGCADAEPWWSEAMAQAAVSGFTSL